MSLCIEIASNDDMPCFPNDRDAAPCVQVPVHMLPTPLHCRKLSGSSMTPQIFCVHIFLCSGLSGQATNGRCPDCKFVEDSLRFVIADMVCSCLPPQKKKIKKTKTNKQYMEFKIQFATWFCGTVWRWSFLHSSYPEDPNEARWLLKQAPTDHRSRTKSHLIRSTKRY